MTNDSAISRAGRLLHLRGETLAKGEPVALPLTQSSMFHLPGAPDAPHMYGRMSNPVWTACEDALALLEDAPCLLFPSGMAAIAAVFHACLKSGDKVLLPSDGYYVTRVLVSDVLARFGVTAELRPTASYLDGGFDGFALVHIETPSNPGLDICDIAAVAAAARAAGAITVADNTTMTPLGQRPLDLGVDIVVAADTKAPAGHSDILMGHAATRDPALHKQLADWRRITGVIPGPHEAWLLHRSLQTLEMRFERMCANAEQLAPVLAGHPAVKKIRYPGLPGDPAANLAAQQMTRPGFLISLELESEQAAENFINTCPLIQPATSFGGVHTSAERRARWGDAVAPGFVRLSVGCEPYDDLEWALSKALGT
jgi:cystathionine gamma-lyase